MKTYEVLPGETLASIAKRLFGDESLATYLASINQISEVYPGQMINVGVVEVSSKYNYTPWIIGGLLLAGAVWYSTKN